MGPVKWNLPFIYYFCEGIRQRLAELYEEKPLEEPEEDEEDPSEDEKEEDLLELEIKNHPPEFDSSDDEMELEKYKSDLEEPYWES